MIEPNIYCKASGMVMECVSRSWKETGKLPVIIEVGCAEGYGTMRFAGFCEKVICIDPMVHGRPDIISYQTEDMIADGDKVAQFERRTKEFPVSLIKGCSLWPDVLERVKNEVGLEKADVVLIDGCHHPYEAVLADMEAYLPFVRPGGYIVVDDLYEGCIEQAYDVFRDKYNLEQVDRWGVRSSEILQECAALRKPFTPATP